MLDHTKPFSKILKKILRRHLLRLGRPLIDLNHLADLTPKDSFDKKVLKVYILYI
jgi:hypothetical protein